MDWKRVKDFIKPDWRKGIIFTAILLFGALSMMNNIPFAAEIFFLTSLMRYIQIGPFIGVILYLIVLVIYWQILSSIIIYIYEKIRGRR